MENIEARQNESIAGAGVGRNMVTETGIEMGVEDVRSHRLEGRKNGEEVGAAKGIATGIDKFELYVYVFLHFVPLVGGCWAQCRLIWKIALLRLGTPCLFQCLAFDFEDARYVWLP